MNWKLPNIKKIWDSKIERSWLKLLAYTLWAGTIGGMVFCFILFYIFSRGELPSFEQLENPQYDLASIVYSDNLTPFGKYYIENREFVDYEDLSPHLINALISTEDIRYHSHSGIDFIALFRVLFKTVLTGDNNSGGGSTISQQLAKLLFKRQSLGKGTMVKIKNLLRVKFKEWITSVRLEKQYTKGEIIAMYLNKFEFINGAHGIQAAAQIYFSKDQKDLKVQEAATLVGMLKNPSRYNPIRFTEHAENRRNTVLYLLARNNKISKVQRDTLVSNPLDMSAFNRTTHVDGHAPYFRSELTKWLKTLFSKNENKKLDGTTYDIYRDGLKIYTTINLSYQDHAEQALKTHMAKIQNRYWRVWKRKNPLTYQMDKTDPADSLKMAAWQTTVDRRIRTLSEYSFLFDQHFSSLSKESDENFGVSLKEPTLRQLIANKKYVSQIDEEKKPNFVKLLSSPLWATIKIQWDKFHAELETVLNIEKERPVFAYNEEGFEVKDLTLFDSLMHMTRIMQSGLLSINPSNGQIKAWVGGVDFKNFKYDHVNLRRQVGSTIKPFVYSTAIGVQGLSPCHEYDDLQYSIAPGDANFNVSKTWTPSNANGLFTGNKYNLYQGLLYSKNSITVRIVKELGTIEPIRELLDNVGISKSETLYNGRLLIPRVPSICLGSVDLSVMEITGAYTTFANNGIYSKPSFIDRIEDKNGKIIYQSTIEQNVAINPFYNAVMLDMLRNNTGSGLGLKSQNGGKTGTTNDYADGWFLGITPTLVTGIWVGGDEKWVKFYTLDDGQGFVLARPIFMDYMKRLEADENCGYDSGIKFRKSPNNIQDFIDCDRYKRGEPEDEFAKTTDEDLQFDEFDEDEFGQDEFLDEFEEEIIEEPMDTIGLL
ncbi:MAG: transglycosylase domain-containing protein [Saprospiraceae bacterium]